jgi:hypothetical protein
MQWGKEIMEWLATAEGRGFITSAVIPALAIIVAGIVGALIGRGATKRMIAQHNRDALTAAVQSLVLAGRKAASWNDIQTIERVQVDHLIGEAETRIRLLAVPGAAWAASWAAHQLEEMKRNSAGFSFQAQQTLGEYRDRLIAWSEKPRQAKKLFGADLERWKYDADPAEQELVAEQARWESAHSLDREAAEVTPAQHESAPAHSAPAPAAQTYTSPVSYSAPPAVRPEPATADPVTSTPFAPTEAAPTQASSAEASSAEADDAPAPLRARDVRERTEHHPEH